MKLKSIAMGLILSGSLVAKANTDISWQEYRGHLYGLTPEPMTWYDAENYATSKGGHLVSFNDAEEENWIKKTFGTTEYLIGFFQPKPGINEPAGGWEWTSGDPVTYTNWHYGEPNNDHGYEHFAMMNMYHYQGGGWNDMPDWWTNLHGVVETIPEPSTLSLAGAALVGLAGIKKIKGKK